MKKNTMSYRVKQYLILAGPATFLFCAVVILPFVYGLYLTFTSWDGISKTKPFVGLANYIAAFQDAAYWQAMGRTIVYSVVSVVLVNIVAFLQSLRSDRLFRSEHSLLPGFRRRTARCSA